MPHRVRWGIIGVGAAGRARTLALRHDPRSVAIGGLRGSPDLVDLPRFVDVDALLGVSDAVCICTPDPTHPDMVARALRADCHVVCEYPLAPSRLLGEQLFELARQRRRVLHVGHIELLTPVMAWLRQHVRGRRLLRSILEFTSPTLPSSPIAHANIARISRLVDLFGLPVGFKVLHRGPDFLRATLYFPDGDIHLDFRHDPEFRRSLRWDLGFADGTVRIDDRAVSLDGVPVPLDDAPSPFQIDQLHAAAIILDDMPSYAPAERVLVLSELADQLMVADVGDETPLILW